MNQKLIIKPIYEFLVWDNCSNNCQFCHQRNNPRNFDLLARSHILYENEFIVL